MFQDHWKILMSTAIKNGLLWTTVLTIIVYLAKGVFKPSLVLLWFLFFFLSGGIRKWIQLKKANEAE